MGRLRELRVERDSISEFDLRRTVVARFEVLLAAVQVTQLLLVRIKSAGGQHHRQRQGVKEPSLGHQIQHASRRAFIQRMRRPPALHHRVVFFDDLKYFSENEKPASLRVAGGRSTNTVRCCRLPEGSLLLCRRQLASALVLQYLSFRQYCNQWRSCYYPASLRHAAR